MDPTLEVKAFPFLLVPEWDHPEAPWADTVSTFFGAFPTDAPVSLILPYDPGMDLELLSSVMGRLAGLAGLDLEAVPDTVLHPTEGSAAAWRGLARQARAVLVPADGETAWLADLPVPALHAPGPETLQAFVAQEGAAASWPAVPPEARGRVMDFLALLQG